MDSAGANRRWSTIMGKRTFIASLCHVNAQYDLNEDIFIGLISCPLDGEIMGQFEYSEDRAQATVSFPAHKFPYTASVYYQCNVRLCALADPSCQKVDGQNHLKLFVFIFKPKHDFRNKNLNPNTIFMNKSFKSPNCDPKRPKRDVDDNDDGHPATIEVYSGLYVNENAEVIDGDDSVFAEKVTLDKHYQLYMFLNCCLSI